MSMNKQQLDNPIYQLACEKIDHLEAWGKVPSCRAMLIKAFEEFANELLAWNSHILYPHPGVPVIVRVCSYMDEETSSYSIAFFSDSKGWLNMDHEQFPHTMEVAGWRYIYE